MLSPFYVTVLYDEHSEVCKRHMQSVFIAGILTQRWRLLLQPIIADPTKVTTIVKAMCALHNYLSHMKDETYCPAGYADHIGSDGQIAEGFWRQSAINPLDGLEVHSRSMTTAAIQLRDQLSDYFIGDGSVEWQLQHIRRR